MSGVTLSLINRMRLLPAEEEEEEVSVESE